MKICQIYDQSWRYGEYNGETTEYYTSYEVAKRHFDEKVKRIKETDVFKNNISNEDENSISYSDGYKWSYTLGIVNDIEVKES